MVVLHNLCRHFFCMKINEKLVLFLLASINFTHILDFMIMMPLGNYLMPYFKITTQQFSFLVSAYTFSAAISGFTAAFFVDRFDRKKVLLLGYTGFLLGTIACGISPTYHLLLISRTIAGLFGGLIGAQVLSIISDIFPYEKRGKAMGSVMSAFALASSIGVPFALYLANLISWHAPFLLVGILGVVLVPLLLKHIPAMDKHINNSEEKKSKFESLIMIKNSNKLMLTLLFACLMMLGHFLIIPFINPYMVFNNGYSKNITPMIYMVGGAASFISSGILGKLSDIHGKLKIFSICILLSLPLVIFVTHVPPIPFWIVLIGFAIWFTISTGRGIAGSALISNFVDAKYRGSFMSYISSVQQLGTSLASFIAGLIVVKAADGKILHYKYLGYLSILILVLTFLLANFLFKNTDKSKNLAEVSKKA